MLDLEGRPEDELSDIKNCFVKLGELARAKTEGPNGERRPNSVERAKPAKPGSDINAEIPKELSPPDPGSPKDRRSAAV